MRQTGLLSVLVRFSLRFRGVIVALACMLIAYSLYQLTQAKFDVFPEFTPPQVVIQTEAPGLSPEQVELLVTQPIERVLTGSNGLATIRSSSIQGLSLVTLIFNPDIAIQHARQMVDERLQALSGQLPEEARTPIMTPLTTSTSFILVIGLTSNQHSLMELRTSADWLVKPRLLAIPGVAKIGVLGGEVRQLQIQVKPEQLLRYDLALDDIMLAARRATGIRGAGFIETANQRLVLETKGQTLTPAQLAKTVVSHQNGASLTLGDVATVTDGPEPMIGGALINGQPGVVMIISDQYRANTLEVTERLEQALADLRPILAEQGMDLHADIFRPASFIQIATRNVAVSLLLGAVLVMVVLLLFLFNFRASAISCTAIPLSLLGAVAVLENLGMSLNTMTLGGLAIAIGEVVDDAVIDVENILRRLHANRYQALPRPAIQVIFEASLEVRSAVVYATFAVILVFVPVLFLSGLAGRLFSPLAIAYILAVGASLVVAITVTPALCCLLLGNHHLPEREAPLVRWLKHYYRRLLALVERQHWPVIITVVLATAIGIGTLPLLGGGFLPELREGHFIVHMSAAPGTSLPESLRIGREVTQALLQLPFIRTVAQRAGRAELADDTWGPHYSEINVDLQPLDGEASELALARIRETLATFPGVSFAVKTFLTERVEETLSGYTSSVVVNVYGSDLNRLDREARRIARLMSEIRGSTEVQLPSPPGTPTLIIQLKHDALTRWGFTPVEVLEVIRAAYQGAIVGHVYEDNRVFNVAVILAPEIRQQIGSVGDLPLRNRSGTYIQLKQLADIDTGSGRYSVLHNGARRVQTITCNVKNRDVNSFQAEVKRRIQTKLKLPPGYYIEFGGAAEAQAKSQRDLILNSILAGIGIILLLTIIVADARNLMLLLINLPFALVGGVLAVFFSGGWLSVGSLVGFVTLFGITLRNSIMLISHYEHLITIEGLLWNDETALRGAAERLTPILMTAVVTALGLLPLALGSGDPGREIEGPMAIVILGGLFTSTVLNLLVLPTLALRYGRFNLSEP